MKTPEYTPLPQIEPERDGVMFDKLALPVGFDQERLLINTASVRKVARLAGLGGIMVIGSKGQKSEDEFGISGIGADGSAFMNIVRRRQKSTYVNGVKVLNAFEMAVWTDEDMLPNEHSYRPALILANISERDEILRTDNRYKRGLLDPNGHANFLDTAISKGLHEAAKQRYVQKSGPGRVFTYGAIGLNAAVSIETQTPTSLLTMLGVWGAVDLGFGLYQKKTSHRPLKERQNSVLIGLDRKIGAQTLAQYSIFVQARE